MLVPCSSSTQSTVALRLRHVTQDGQVVACCQWQAAAAEERAAEAHAAAEAADAARDDAEAALEAAMERIVAAERKASEVWSKQKLLSALNPARPNPGMVRRVGKLKQG